MVRRSAVLLGMAAVSLLASAPVRAENPILARLDNHRFNYVLPWAYNFNPDSGDSELERAEFKFQLSFKYPVFEKLLGDRLGLYFAYTQLSFWQLYKDLSSPIRETDYEPETYLVVRSLGEALGVSLEELRLGYNHQSNGQAGEESRSWNRLFAEGHFLAGPVQVSLRPWWRIPERGEDSNPDIHRYMGYGDLRLLVPVGDWRFSLLLRNNLRRDNRGAVEVGMSWPISTDFRLYMQYFEGYGESLLDYNHPVSRIGAGFIFSETR